MIQLTRLNGTEFLINCDHIEVVEATPDTVITLQNDHKWVVRETPADLGFEDAERKVTIAGNSILLAELLNNLIDNALRYTPRSGRITVRVQAQDGEARLEVEDSGPGIPVTERERVFDRFYRVLGTPADGSGLGLAIVREIAQKHGATVTIEDNPSPHSPLAGMRITICFPLSDSNHNAGDRVHSA